MGFFIYSDKVTYVFVICMLEVWNKEKNKIEPFPLALYPVCGN